MSLFWLPCWKTLIIRKQMPIENLYWLQLRNQILSVLPNGSKWNPTEFFEVLRVTEVSIYCVVEHSMWGIDTCQLRLQTRI